MKSPDVFLQQKGLAALGFDPGPLDGDPGPKTMAARKAWEASLLVDATNITARIVAFAKADLGIHESAGKNQGPGIEKYWPATNYPDGYKNREPYCAAAVCYWIRQAVAAQSPKVAFLLPTSAKAFDFEKWGRNNAGRGVQVLGKNDDILPGDIIVWDFSHVGIAEAKRPRTRDVQTIDANTSPESGDNEGGDNEGGGVYRRTRSRNLIRAVVRITA